MRVCVYIYKVNPPYDGLQEGGCGLIKPIDCQICEQGREEINDEVLYNRNVINPQTAGVPYTEQNHLHGQWQESVYGTTPKKQRKMM